jgi:proteasome lid subunit RPN8/RPN11
MGMMVEISSTVLAEVQRRAAASPDVEVCGLLFGSAERIDALQPCRNIAAEPATSFEIDPAALVAAYRAERSGGPRIVGCYHSHPSGDARPSQRDADAAEPGGWVWLIIGRNCATAHRAWEGGRLHGRFDRLDMLVVPDA